MKMNMLGKGLTELLAFLFIFQFLVEGCKSIPEGQEAPLATITWDTTLQIRGIILPGDSVHIFSDIGSKTSTNRLFFLSERFPISNRFDFFGPDSDWVFQFSKEIYGGLVIRDKQSFCIPSGIRPGFYKFKTCAKDAQGRTSDTSRFEFITNGVPYPVISISKPAGLENPVLLTLDTLLQQYKLPLSSVADSNVPGDFYFQWLDSLGRFPVSDSLPLISKSGIGTLLTCDTNLIAPLHPSKGFKVRLGFSTVQRRRMEVKFDVYRK